MNGLTACTCTEPGWCQKHQFNKGRLLWLACQRDSQLFNLWEQLVVGAPATAAPPKGLPRCQYRGTEIVEHLPCEICGNRQVLIPIHACDIHGRCSERRFGNRTEIARTLAACTTCPDYVAAVEMGEFREQAS
jgi:hypothetical protein